MKNILLILLSITTLFAQKRQTTEFVTIKTYVRNGALEKPFKIGYLAYLPENYICSPTKFPLIISCHGNGEKGTLTPDILRKSFLPNRLDNGLNIPFIVISPQTNGYKPAWNNPQFYRELLDSIKLKYTKIDTNQIFIVGYSGGGEGVCTYAKSGLPFVGIGTFSFVNKLVGDETCALNNKKVWSFHCLDDATVGVGTTKTLLINIKKCDANAKPKSTFYPTGGHNSWSKGLATDSLFQYFLSK
jgi:predicted peptidase